MITAITILIVAVLAAGAIRRMQVVMVLVLLEMTV